MAFWTDLRGILGNILQLGVGGPNVKANSAVIEARNAADSAYAQLSALLFATYGNDFELNSGAAGSAADWKMTLRRPSTGMSHALIFVFPAADPAPGQALTVTSLVGDVVTLQWTTVAAGTDKIVTDTTTLAFGASSPVAMFSLPSGAIIHQIDVIIDTAFNGTATMSVGIVGTVSKYMAAVTGLLQSVATTVFTVHPGIVAAAGESLIITYSAGSASAGSARVIVHYSIPS